MRGRHARARALRTARAADLVEDAGRQGAGPLDALRGRRARAGEDRSFDAARTSARPFSHGPVRRAQHRALLEKKTIEIASITVRARPGLLIELRLLPGDPVVRPQGADRTGGHEGRAAAELAD